jgi:hypothetical protein
MVVEILHKVDRSSDQSLAEIAREYRARFHQDAVLRVTEPAQARLY